MRKQQGLTFIGFIFASACLIFGCIVIMRLFPVYYGQYVLKRAVESLNTLPDTTFKGTPSVVAMRLREKLDNQLAIESVNFITRGDIKIKFSKPHYDVNVNYERRVKLIGNLDVVATFAHTYQVGKRDEE